MQCFNVHRKWTDMISLELFFNELVPTVMYAYSTASFVRMSNLLRYMTFENWFLSPKQHGLSMDPQDSVYRHIACMLLDIYIYIHTILKTTTYKSPR